MLVDGTYGLYLGWVSVATAANITATLVASGVNPAIGIAQWIAVLVVAVAAAIGVVLARTLGGRIGIAVAMAWGLSWIAVGRLTSEPASSLVGVAAIVAALVVAGAAVFVRTRSGRSAAVATA